MKWVPFTYGSDTFDLCHLHPRTISYVQEAKGDKPERTYTVEVQFSLHCFTRDPKDGENVDAALLCSDHRETRVFDRYRWELSLHLPKIVETLMERKCFHTGYGNYLTVEILKQDHSVAKYEIFFQLSKASRKGLLNLFVQTAYVRDRPDAGGKPKHRPPIGFAFLLHNTLANIPIKVSR